MSIRFLVAFSLVLVSAPFANGQMNVWLDFDAQWETNLDNAATSAGVSVFSAAERTTIQNNVEAQMNAIFSNHLLTMSQADPGGTRTRIDFGATGSSALGSAPLDYFNASASQTANMFIDNFDFIINEFSGTTSRATQIDQLSTAIAGTAAHELGHTIGMHHHHAYGTAAINPSNYNSTGGAQNDHIIASGSTGLGESGREVLRSLSQWSNFITETAGGLIASLHGTSGVALVANPILEQDFFSGGDVGNTTGTASALGTAAGAISGYEDAGHAFSQLDSGADIDTFSLTLSNPGLISAEVVHNSRWGSSLNPFLEIIGPDGTTVLASNDNGNYSNNTYGSGGFGTNDSFLINVEAASAGTYFFRVSSTSGSGFYSLLFGADHSAAVPEPTCLGLIAISGIGMLRLRRRKA
ncbi:MAG: PEP-CTERM sorting domain-containing protein [Planctomycetota bacterium]